MQRKVNRVAQVLTITVRIGRDLTSDREGFGDLHDVIEHDVLLVPIRAANVAVAQSRWLSGLRVFSAG